MRADFKRGFRVVYRVVSQVSDKPSAIRARENILRRYFAKGVICVCDFCCLSVCRQSISAGSQNMFRRKSYNRISRERAFVPEGFKKKAHISVLMYLLKEPVKIGCIAER